MEINWLLRLKNKATLAALIPVVLGFIYQVAAILGIAVPVTQDALMQVLLLILNALVALGVVVDPTTQGIGDSKRALTYTEPKGGE